MKYNISRKQAEKITQRQICEQMGLELSEHHVQNIQHKHV